MKQADDTFDYTEMELRRVGLIHSLVKTGMDIENLKKYKQRTLEELDYVIEKQKIINNVFGGNRL